MLRTNETNSYNIGGRTFIGVPQEDWPFEATLEFLKDKDFPLQHPAWSRCAVLYGMSVQQLVQHVKTPQAQELDDFDTTNITPNKQLGPLSQQQKMEINKHHHDRNTNELAILYNTDKQSVRRAKRGEFKHTPTPPVDKLHPERPYGPLTYAEKMHIYKHCQDESPTELARYYSTSTTNIRLAQQGQFSQVKRHADRKQETVILAQAALILGVDLAVLETLKEKNDDA